MILGCLPKLLPGLDAQSVGSGNEVFVMVVSVVEKHRGQRQ